ncbi:MAG: hypothetical protein KatS3mg031_0972 [Chitinophagales bacterium]|nr:MAG: hypothetical protein KatS3mg031_0972 [Chitinophagales bacterium]
MRRNNIITGFRSALLTLTLALGLCVSSSYAQRSPAGKDTITLEGFINENKTLTADKVYLVKFNVKVGKAARLTVNPGTHIVFDPATSIVLEGGLTITGAPNNFVELTSRNPNTPGNGIVVRGTEGGDITIRYAWFKNLNIPLRFESEWYRKNVTIEKNVFTELFTGESNVLITSPVMPYDATGESVCNFSFSYNAFYDNWGSIFIENFEDNVLKLTFNNNLITNNVVYGIDIGIPSNTPVFGLYDAIGAEYKMKMENNSIFGNYQVNSSTDTIIREISIGIQGDGEFFEIPNNFFRSKNPDYVSSTFDHFYQNSRLPLLKPEPLLPAPKEETPPHIWKVLINGVEVKNYDSIPDVEPRNVQFELHFNKPVVAFDKVQLEAVFYDTISRTLQKAPVALSQPRWSPDRKTYTFVASNAAFVKNPYAYAILKNFKDEEGFIVPEFTLGRRQAINNLKRTAGPSLRTVDIISRKAGTINVEVEGGAFLPDEKSVKTIETLTNIGGINQLGPYRSLTKTWEVGLLLGVSNYMGTLPYKLIEPSAFHFSAGFFGQYNLNKWISLRAMFWYGRISGNEISSKDPDRAARALNFRNDLVEGSITFHWHLLKYGTSRGEKFTPTIFAGIALHNNNPKARIYLYKDDQSDPVYLTYRDGSFQTDGSGKDVWVPLRPIGTEGQTVGGRDPEADPLNNSPNYELYKDHFAPKQYSRFQVSFPIGISLDYIIYNKWTLGIELGVRISTTKYLDDVGGYYWDRARYNSNGDMLIDPVTGIPLGAHQSIVDANPEIWGKAGREKVRLDNTITFTDPNTGITTTYNTAALLANPSLVNVDQGVIDNNPNSPNPNSGYNDAFTFPDGRKTNSPNKLDHYAFLGIKITKVIAKKEKKYKVREIKIKDNDKDGLSDADEKARKTNPRNPDTDGDGLIDGEEVGLGTDPLNPDTDGDQLSDYVEVNTYSTNPNKKDSDDDGLDDGMEINITKTDPLNADTDGGGVNDGDEVNRDKTNPRDKTDDRIDSDGDGIINSLDECPYKAGLPQFKGCPDTDGDGIEDRLDDCPNIPGPASNYGCPQE